MKKNITINMLGGLYNIDEDAYELLNNYLDGMKEYFARHGADSEIASDIELRVAELMTEYKNMGHAVITIEDVRTICERVGTPEQMDDEDADEGMAAEEPAAEAAPHAGDGRADEGAKGAGADAEAAPGEGWFDGIRRRRFYRDATDKMLGGVLAGMAHYVGGSDPLPWRIAFVLLLIVGVPMVSTQFFILIYLLLWAFVPVAATPEDRLRQQGRNVNAANVQSEILGTAGAAGKTAAAGGGAHEAANGCLSAVVWVFKIGLVLMLSLMAFVLISVLVGVTVPVVAGVVPGVSGFVGWGLLLSLGVICLPIVALVHAMFGSREWSRTTRVAMLVAWIVMLLADIHCLSRGLRDLDGRLFDSNGVLRLHNSGIRWYVTGTDEWELQEGERDSVAVEVSVGDSSVVRINVKDNKGLPEDGAVEVFPEEAQ